LGKERSSRLIATYCQISHCGRKHWLKQRKTFLEIKLTMKGQKTHTSLKLFLEEHALGGYFRLGCQIVQQLGRALPLLNPTVYFWDDFCTEFFLPRMEPEAQPTEVIQQFCLSFSRLKIMPLGSCLGVMR